ncbi:MAG: DUF4290 domain-containing protein [Saprospiraceae bacterium]
MEYEMEYNSSRDDLIIPEYGRNIKKMVDYALTVADREERNTICKAIISVMGQLFPQLRDIEDYNHKLWDHLYIISDFELDVDSPYPKPTREEMSSKPDRVPYPQKKIDQGHYGYVLEELIRKASAHENEDERKALTIMAANMMKKNYANWNRQSVSDDLIKKQLVKMSNGKLSLEDDYELVAVAATKPPPRQTKSNNYKKGKKSPRRR